MVRILHNSHGHPFNRKHRNNHDFRGKDSAGNNGRKRNTNFQADDIDTIIPQRRLTASGAPSTISPTNKGTDSSMVISKPLLSFCKACALAKTRSRPSYATDVTSRPEKFTISGELTKLPFRKTRGRLPGRLTFSNFRDVGDSESLFSLVRARAV